MFEKLKQRWKVSGLQFVLIFATFALGGSLTGWLAKKGMSVIGIDQPWLFLPLYLLLVTLLWPFCVLLIGIPLGQFRFFWNYEKKIFRWFGKIFGISKKVRSTNYEVYKIAIFASGVGTNAQKIIDHFRWHPSIKVALIVCNKPGAGALTIAQKENIPFILIDKEKFLRGNAYVDELKEKGIDFIVLAGFLWIIPIKLIEAYPDLIINIHPALLPKYGGKGMYNNFVHEAVIASGDPKSGITIHYVDEKYDNGDIIFQATCPVLQDDTPETLASRIHQLEHANYPAVIEKTVLLRNRR